MQSAIEKKIRKFLQGPRKGETFELRNGLVSQYRHERKDAIQRVIQAMTVGKDVSSLFPDVLKNIATYDIEQKKLVYLYLMNYSKTHPELCILAVNTFVQDTEDPNPLIRALAIRTMGCIRVQKMVDYMEIPLSRTLKDDNPYVRKTATLCVAKLFDLNPEMCVEFGFLAKLQEMVKDPNPMVVANAISSLYEIRDTAGDHADDIITITSEISKNMLLCLNECTEWGRVTILEALTDYTPANPDEAHHIIERIIPQLQHVNPTVVLSSIKAILYHIEFVNDEIQSAVLRKLSAPLVSLVSSSIPEAQYVGLRNIRIILEKYPSVLSKELRVFFIKYSDPLYLKLEKLEIMVRLANESNAALLLGELQEYAMEFEPSLVSKAIKSIGTVAIKLQPVAIKAINLLLSLIDQRGGELIINEAVAVLANIIRRYPGQNDLLTLVIPVVCNHVVDLENTDALVGYIFLMGTYPKYFSGLAEKLDQFIDDFQHYDPGLQLAVVSSIVKIHLIVPGSYSSQLQRVLEVATTECENADVRDRAYMYWRLLSSSLGGDAQQQIALAKLPPIEDTIAKFNPVVLDELIHELSTIASVYHKPASTFVDHAHSPINQKARQDIEDLKALAKTEIINNTKNENLLDFDDDVDTEALSSTGGASTLLAELNDLFNTPPPVSQPGLGGQQASQSQATQDILNMFNQPHVQAPVSQMASMSVDDNKGTKGSANDLLDLF